MTDNSWDEQIVNNIDIYKIHLLKDFLEPNGDVYRVEKYVESLKIPVKVWDASINLEIYTREVVDAEKRTQGGWKRKK